MPANSKTPASTQLELQYMHDARMREHLLQEVELPGRNRTLMAAMLREISRHQQCYLSQSTFARQFKVSRSTIQRALRSLMELDLVAVTRTNRFVGGEPKSLNHYSVNWTALGQIVSHAGQSPQDPADNHTTNASLSPDQCVSLVRPMRHLEPTNASVTPDQCVTLARPMRQLGPTNASPEWCTNRTELKETTTTESEWVVVVSSLGVARAEEALQAADALGLSNDDIRERIDAFQGTPAELRNPGVLYNWLSKRGSFRTASDSGELALKLRKGLDSAAEHRRANLIAHGRRSGWNHRQMQAAIDKFEQEHLPRTEAISSTQKRHWSPCDDHHDSPNQAGAQTSAT